MSGCIPAVFPDCVVAGNIDNREIYAGKDQPLDAPGDYPNSYPALAMIPAFMCLGVCQLCFLTG